MKMCVHPTPTLTFTKLAIMNCIPKKSKLIVHFIFTTFDFGKVPFLLPYYYVSYLGISRDIGTHTFSLYSPEAASHI